MFNRITLGVLKRLFRGGYWGRRPINFDDLYAGVPKHVPKRDFMKACKSLVAKQLLIQKPGEFGPRFGLNPRKKGEIEEIIQGFNSKSW